MAAQALAPPATDKVLSRFGLLATAVFLFATGFRIFPAVSVSIAATLAVVLLYAIAFTLTGLALVSRAPFTRGTQMAVAGSLALSLLCSVAYGILYEIPSYGTDVMAFAHAGGEKLLDGVNPYSLDQSDIQTNLSRLTLREGLMTETLTGRPVAGVTYYPGLHVLIYTAGLAVGVSDLRWVTLVFQLVALAVIWINVGDRIRYLLPAVLLLEPFLMTQFTAGGVSDWLWVLPLLIGAVALHREDYTVSGIWVGLACAVKQQPWFALPFLAIWVIKSSQRDKVASENSTGRNFLAFSSMVGLGFVVPNFPFMIWSFSEWLEGVLGPAWLDLVPSGQGIVLLLSQGYLNNTRAEFGVLVVLVTILLCLIYYRRFERLKDILWLLPPLVMFFAYRSLHSYFVYWLPLIALWIALRTARPDHEEGLTLNGTS